MAAIKLYSDLNAMVFRITVAEGDRVAAGETLLLLESMKMERWRRRQRGGSRQFWCARPIWWVRATR